MDRKKDGWSKPYNLGPPINTDDPEYFPSVTRDGTIYFTREIDDGGKKRSLIHRARMAGDFLADYFPPAQQGRSFLQPVMQTVLPQRAFDEAGDG